MLFAFAAVTVTAISAFAQTDQPPQNYQPPPGYKLVPIDQPWAQPAPPQQPAAAAATGSSRSSRFINPSIRRRARAADLCAIPTDSGRRRSCRHQPHERRRDRQPHRADRSFYPDPLIAIVLPASTFPLEVGSASQWAHVNPGAPEYAIQQLPWEPPIKALIHYPSLLDMMANRPDWTQPPRRSVPQSARRRHQLDPAPALPGPSRRLAVLLSPSNRSSTTAARSASSRPTPASSMFPPMTPPSCTSATTTPSSAPSSSATASPSAHGSITTSTGTATGSSSARAGTTTTFNSSANPGTAKSSSMTTITMIIMTITIGTMGGIESKDEG